MSRYAAVVLFLAIGLVAFCAANSTVTTTEPITKTTTAKTTTTTATTSPTTTETTTATTSPTNATTTPATATTTATTKMTTAETTTSTTQTTSSAAPNTTSTSTTTPSTTTPTPTLPPPTTGKYKLQKDNSTCLLAEFGLRIGFQGDKYEEMNFKSTNETGVSGSCGVNSSELVLQSDTLILTFTFINDTKKFSLHALNVTGNTSSGVAFSQVNSNMTLWQAALGSSYMCTKEQNYTITEHLTVFTFNLHIQPFGIKKDGFSTAQECSMDDTSILIPIVVGAALAGLILIVVIAYVIGRRKTYVGYQTL